MANYEDSDFMIQPRITGYRKLSDSDAELINRLKAKEQDILAFLDVVAAEGGTLRWVNIARTHVEQGFMAACRAVAKPNSEV